MLVLLQAAAAAAAAALPVGTWKTTIGGVPNSKLPDAPSLGNGYAGVVLADGPFDSLPSLGSVDLWLNTNANWTFPQAATNNSRSFPRLTTSYTSIVRTSSNTGYVLYGMGIRAFTLAFQLVPNPTA